MAIEIVCGSVHLSSDWAIDVQRFPAREPQSAVGYSVREEHIRCFRSFCVELGSDSKRITREYAKRPKTLHALSPERPSADGISLMPILSGSVYLRKKVRNHSRIELESEGGSDTVTFPVWSGERRSLMGTEESNNVWKYYMFRVRVAFLSSPRFVQIPLEPELHPPQRNSVLEAVIWPQAARTVPVLDTEPRGGMGTRG